ncbi:MAG: VTT domain-containing protein [Candidatus Woesearchaeota archaeon]
MHKSFINLMIQHREKRQELAGKTTSIDRFFLFFVILFVLYLVYYYNQEHFINWLKQYGPIYSVYSHLYGQFAERTLLGLLYASFFGSLFFVFLPIEVVFIYYSELHYPKPLVIAIVISGNLLGLAVNYGIGRLIGMKPVMKIFKKSFDKFVSWLTKYGGWIIFAGNIFVFPIEPISVVVGAGRYPFKKFMGLSLIGKLIKFAILLAAGNWLVRFIPGI